MGCAGSRAKKEEPVKKIRKPKPWKHSEPITRAQLVQMRDEFWDTAPHYGGRKGDWAAASLCRMSCGWVIIWRVLVVFSIEFNINQTLDNWDYSSEDDSTHDSLSKDESSHLIQPMNQMSPLCTHD